MSHTTLLKTRHNELLYSNIFNICRHGATGDGKTKDTKAIQTAIDLCNKAGGGIVFCPPGTYLTDPIYLRSNVNLNLSAGATLLGSPDSNDYKDWETDIINSDECIYNFKQLILAINERNIAITGQGTVDGQGDVYLEPNTKDKLFGRFYKVKDKIRIRPAKLVSFVSCENVLIENTTFVDSPAWTLWVFSCDKVNFRGIKIINNFEAINTDGISVDCSSNVTISDSYIYAGDDCIVLRAQSMISKEPKACENITVTNCMLISSCNAIRVGWADDIIRNCVFSNLIISKSHNGITTNIPNPVKAMGNYPSKPPDAKNCTGYPPGPLIENISFSNIIIETEYLGIDVVVHDDAPVRHIRNFNFSNIQIISEHASRIVGSPSVPIEGFNFNNIRMTIKGTAKEIASPCGAAHGFYCKNARNIFFQNMEIEWIERQDICYSAFLCEDVDGLGLDQLVSRQSKDYDNAPVINLSNVKNAFIRNCRAEKGTNTFLEIKGKETSDITVIGNDLHHAEQAFSINDTLSDKSFFQTANIYPESKIEKEAAL